MLYTRSVPGRVADVVERLSQAVANHKFGVLGTIDLKAKMIEKGVPFERDCTILEVCNPGQAKKVLDHDMSVSTSLPCRISVYEDGDNVTIASVRPRVLLEMYPGSGPLAPVAAEVEETILAIIDEA